MKRFVETSKWEDQWFRKLPPEAKLFWDWVCCKCDQAGVIDPDFDLAGFQIGAPINKSIMDYFKGRIEVLPSGKLHILKFVQFQYGKLSRSCKPHIPVYAALERHGLNPDEISQNESFKNTVDDYMKVKVIERDGLFCVYSGQLLEPSNAVIDHIHPRSKGGTNTLDNLVVASFTMNSLKRDMHVHNFCIAQSLDVDVVFQRLSKATGKPFKAFVNPLIGYHGSLKEKEKEKEKDTDSESRAKDEPENPPAKKPDDFDQFWTAYPRKVQKGDAIKAWAKMKPDLAEVLKALEWQKRSLDWTKDDGQFIPYPASYLNGMRWTDERPVTQPQQRKFPSCL